MPPFLPLLFAIVLTSSVFYGLINWGYRIARSESRNHFRQTINSMDTREPHNLKQARDRFNEFYGEEIK